jgi:hypothetical protein
VEEVFMPLNDFREEIIIKNAHLIREEIIPNCLLEFVAHVTAYKVVVKKWSNKDYSEGLSVNDFPGELLDYARCSYNSLKKEQLKLTAGHISVKVS